MSERRIMKMIKGTRTIAEYAILKWLQDENFVMSEFEVTISENEGVVKDKNGDSITLVYDSDSKTVYVRE